MNKYWNFSCDAETLPGGTGTKSKETGTLI